MKIDKIEIVNNAVPDATVTHRVTLQSGEIGEGTTRNEALLQAGAAWQRGRLPRHVSVLTTSNKVLARLDLVTGAHHAGAEYSDHGQLNEKVEAGVTIYLTDKDC